jgi:ABC-type lipoprotein export system ATPase subunit
MGASIQVDDLWKVYEVGGERIEAIRAVSLAIPAGELAAVVGHSGSGKTTLLSIAGGLTEPTRGRVTIDGEDVWALDDAGRSAFRNERIGFIFQFASLLPTLCAIDNVVVPVLFGRRGAARSREAAYARAEQMLSLLGLGSKLDAFPSELSGGQQRRVAIARAFTNRPRLVFADEPTGDLDAKSEAEVMDFFYRVNRDEGTTFVIVTHSEKLAAMTSQTFTMTDGFLSGRRARAERPRCAAAVATRGAP